MKWMIMNYKPYEYELLQEKLNKLGQQGYFTNELGLLTIFEKVDEPIYYHIDFHKTYGSSKSERKEEQDAFTRKFKQKGLHPIYSKHNMYVFTSKKPKDISIDWKDKSDIATGLFKILSFIGFFFSLVALALFSQYIFQLSFDKLMTYGITLTYGGVALLLITYAYRNAMNYQCMGLFHNKIKRNEHHFSSKTLNTFRHLYLLLITLSVLLVVGGMAEDIFNQKSFDTQEHQVIQLKDFKIDDPSSISTQSYSGFTIPHTYISLEEVENGKDALYVKEFVFSSQNKAKQRFNDIKNTPSISTADEIKEKDSLLYGYNNGRLVSISILHNESITIILPTFEFTQEHINTIIEFYK